MKIIKPLSIIFLVLNIIQIVVIALAFLTQDGQELLSYIGLLALVLLLNATLSLVAILSFRGPTKYSKVTLVILFVPLILPLGIFIYPYIYNLFNM